MSEPEGRFERLAIMLESHPDVTLDELEYAAFQYRLGDHMPAQVLARREQNAGRDGRQIMRTVQWAATHLAVRF